MSDQHENAIDALHRERDTIQARLNVIYREQATEKAVTKLGRYYKTPDGWSPITWMHVQSVTCHGRTTGLTLRQWPGHDAREILLNADQYINESAVEITREEFDRELLNIKARIPNAMMTERTDDVVMEVD